MELLQIKKMQAADQITIDQGIDGLFLMERAGQYIAEVTEILCSGPCHVHIFAGVGNNGGDAFVAARFLKQRGYQITLDLIGSPERLKGDAKVNAERWFQSIAQKNKNAKGNNALTKEIPPSQSNMQQAHCIIDGIIGAGLKSDLKPELASLITSINALNKPVIAIDIPTGIDGDTGQHKGAAIMATQTVTFYRPKPGHLLYPGKAHCGQLTVKNIGIQSRTIKKLAPTIWQNDPSLWQKDLPKQVTTSHKYNKGAVLIACSEGAMSGASALAANAAMRTGAGLVTIANADTVTPKQASKTTSRPNPHCFAAIMSVEAPEKNEWSELLKARKITATLIGPGLQANQATRDLVHALITQTSNLCLDAGALTAFAKHPEELIKAISTLSSANIILTPHEGEFTRVFGSFERGGKLAAAQNAAAKTGAVIILKGADTIIASPDGRAIINTNAPSSLASAGTGDVLAGIIITNLAKNMPAFSAAAAAVYIHSKAAIAINHNLVADDLWQEIPYVMNDLVHIS